MMNVCEITEHHQLMKAIWQRWTRINDLHYSQLTVTSIVTLSVSPCEVMSSFVLSLQGNLGQPLLLFPLSLSFV